MVNNDSGQLLFAIPGIDAYEIKNGQERLLTSSGSQTLSLIVVPTSSSPSGNDSQLRLKLSPELDLGLPASTRIYLQSSQSYLIPHREVDSEIGSFTRIKFPPVSQRKGIEDDIDTFESILAQCGLIIERPVPSPPPSSTLPKYDPSTYQSEGVKTSMSSSSNSQGQIFLVDEENGSVLGELGTGFQVVENAQMKAGINDPVEITLPSDNSGKIGVAPAPQSSLDTPHRAYKNSTLVSTASMASQLIISTSGYVSKTLQSQADSFTQKSKPNPKPLTFEPTTHARIRKVRHLTDGAAGLSAKTVGQVQKYAQNLGASVAKRDKVPLTRNSANAPEAKPGLINKSLMAFSTIADGIDQAGRNLLSGTSTAVTTVVSHKYGREAGEITSNISQGVRNVGLVYIDATGVSRRAIIKSVAKGMVVGRAPGGGNLIVGGGIKDSKSSPTSPNTSFNQNHQHYQQQGVSNSINNNVRTSENVTGRSNEEQQIPPPPAYSAVAGKS